MIINRIDIEAFGKFMGKAIEPKRGFNLIYGNNEDGKTTIMAFILMMFYGKTDGGRSSDLLKNPRRRYMPWNGSAMSGAICFEASGNEYRVQKSFKKTAASDRTEVYNLNSGETRTLSAAEEVGEVFFGMDRGEFERSVFIGQTGAFPSDASADSLAMRIANLSVSGDESISSHAVTARLAAAKEELVSKSGKKGFLVDARARLESLADEKHRIERAADEQNELSAEIGRLETEIAESERLLKRIETARTAENAKRALNAYRLLKKKTEQLAAAESGLTDRELSVSRVREVLSECRDIKEKISVLTENIGEDIGVAALEREIYRLKTAQDTALHLSHDIEQLSSAVREEREQIERRAADEKRIKRKRRLAWLTLAAISAAGAVILGLAVNKALLALLALVPICLVMYGRGRICRKDDEMSAALMSEISESVLYGLHFREKTANAADCEEALKILGGLLSDAENEISDILRSCDCGSADELENLAAERRERHESERRRLDMLRESFTACIAETCNVGGFGDALAEYAALNRRIKELDELRRDISTVAAASQIGDIGLENVNSEISRLESLASEGGDMEGELPDAAMLESSLSQMRAALSDCLGRLKPPEKDLETLKNEIDECRNEESRLSERYEVLCIAEEVMNEAISETDRGLGSYLSRRTGDYLSRMTDGRMRDVLVSRSLNVETRHEGETGYHEWKYLSCGAVDRVYLALRLAAADIITKEREPLPIFLDDVLAQYDDKACADTLKFLNEYLRDGTSSRQLLLFTCHRHIADMARELADDLNEITL